MTFNRKKFFFLTLPFIFIGKITLCEGEGSKLSLSDEKPYFGLAQKIRRMAPIKSEDKAITAATYLHVKIYGKLSGNLRWSSVAKKGKLNIWNVVVSQDNGLQTSSSNIEISEAADILSIKLNPSW